MFGFFKAIPSMTHQEFQKQLNKKTVLIDVRSAAEFRSGHIRQAQNIPLDQIRKYQGHKNQPIYLICQSGTRSKLATRQLIAMGYDAINVTGGMNQWQGAITGGY